jgi:hypothetical protein
VVISSADFKAPLTTTFKGKADWAAFCVDVGESCYVEPVSEIATGDYTVMKEVIDFEVTLDPTISNYTCYVATVLSKGMVCSDPIPVSKGKNGNRREFDGSASAKSEKVVKPPPKVVAPRKPAAAAPKKPAVVVAAPAPEVEVVKPPKVVAPKKPAAVAPKKPVVVVATPAPEVEVVKPPKVVAPKKPAAVAPKKPATENKATIADQVLSDDQVLNDDAIL